MDLTCTVRGHETCLQAQTSLCLLYAFSLQSVRHSDYISSLEVIWLLHNHLCGLNLTIFQDITLNYRVNMVQFIFPRGVRRKKTKWHAGYTFSSLSTNGWAGGDYSYTAIIWNNETPLSMQRRSPTPVLAHLNWRRKLKSWTVLKACKTVQKPGSKTRSGS